MDDQQPGALWLADALAAWEWSSDGRYGKAAAELRRLHEVEQEHIKDQSVIAVWRGRTLRAEQQRDELLAALEMALPQLIGRAEQTARAAIEKAEGAK